MNRRCCPECHSTELIQLDIEYEWIFSRVKCVKCVWTGYYLETNQQGEI